MRKGVRIPSSFWEEALELIKRAKERLEESKVKIKDADKQTPT